MLERLQRTMDFQCKGVYLGDVLGLEAEGTWGRTKTEMTHMRVLTIKFLAGVPSLPPLTWLNLDVPGTESPGSCSFFVYLRPAKNAKKRAVT